MNGGAVLALAATVTAGCAHREVVATSSELEAHRAEILRAGHAPVATDDGAVVTVRADQQIQLLEDNGERLPIVLRDALASCPAHPDSPDQLCARPDVHHVVVGEAEGQLDSSDWLAIGVSAAVVGGATACIADCTAHTRDLVLVTGAATLALGAIIVGLHAYNAGHSH